VWCGDAWPYEEQVDAANRTLVVFKARTVYYTTVSFVLYFVPMVVVSLAYTAIVYKLWSRRPPGEDLMTVDGRSTQLRTNKKVRNVRMPWVNGGPEDGGKAAAYTLGLVKVKRYIIAKKLMFNCPACEGEL
jgi:hypothetical protein